MEIWREGKGKVLCLYKMDRAGRREGNMLIIKELGIKLMREGNWQIPHVRQIYNIACAHFSIARQRHSVVDVKDRWASSNSLGDVPLLVCCSETSSLIKVDVLWKTLKQTARMQNWNRCGIIIQCFYRGWGPLGFPTPKLKFLPSSFANSPICFSHLNSVWFIPKLSLKPPFCIKHWYYIIAQTFHKFVLSALKFHEVDLHKHQRKTKYFPWTGHWE